MNNIVAFILGVLSSILAELIIAYFQLHWLASKIAHFIFQHNAMGRLRDYRNKNGVSLSDPYNYIRAEWVCALYDIASSHDQSIATGLLSLANMIDLLKRKELEITYQVVRCFFGTHFGANHEKLCILIISNTYKAIQRAVP